MDLIWSRFTKSSASSISGAETWTAKIMAAYQLPRRHDLFVGQMLFRRDYTLTAVPNASANSPSPLQPFAPEPGVDG